ncbi:protein Skeletor, isoforms B/C [Culicoides brevitarsis]|uniref:protein Skeletor, isoforms B/C n=1 Tax=Culicoides brevitarsis TaxID=469753 RepID=UPI00307C0F87
MSLQLLTIISLGTILSSQLTQAAPLEYYGARIGPLSQLHHGVSGEVFAVDSRTLFIKNFNYDGEGPAAYFYVGNTRAPSNEGAWRLRDERGNAGVIKRYRNKDITLSLPEGKTLRDITWFSVWCDEFAVNFGDVKIPKNLDFPRPQKIAGLKGIHGVTSDPIVLVDAQTLLIPNFSYDGEAPDAKFWTGYGAKPSPQGIRIPDENGKTDPLRKYDKKTIVLTLPGDVTVFDIGHFGVWCEAFTVDFAHVKIPQSANVPPSLKMLGISPQSKLNCEVLLDDIAFEVRWAVAGESVVIQLVAKLDENDYMSFGVSPDVDKSVMIGSDVAVAWIDKVTGKGFANDYFLEAKSQCSGNRGSCPDPVFEKNTNSIRLLNAAMVNGFSIVTYQRPLKASDRFDLPIHTNRSQAIVWAIGPLNDRTETSYHSKVLRTTRLINFGRQPTWNCPVPDSEKKDFERDMDSVEEEEDPKPTRSLPQNHQQEQQGLFEVKQPAKPKPRPVATPRPAAKEGAWQIPPIQCYEPEDGVFYAQMGPTGGKQGYPAITGHVGWGISIYINGLLIPEINVVRGKTYTFVVETGNDPDIPAKYHPFYITDDPVGGFEHKTDEERSKITIFAGAKRLRSGEVVPTGTGRLCNWEPNLDGPPADDYPSFGAYQRSLTLKCDSGEPGVITWTPDENTPDTVYYQCYSHRYLGWRINVLDSCGEEGQASEQVDQYYDRFDILEPAASIRHESKIPPSENYIKSEISKDHGSNALKNHNMNEVPATVNVDLQKNTEISKIIADGIRAAEALEDSITKNSTVLLNNKEIFRPDYPRVPDSGMKLPSHKPPYGPAGVPVFMRGPQGVIMVPGKRRPVQIERRPLQKMPPRPFQVPQPSMIVSHYAKPMPMRSFTKQSFKQKPFPMQGPVLMLGEKIVAPMEIVKSAPKPIDLPYAMSTKQEKNPLIQFRQEKPVKHEKIAMIPKPEKPIAQKVLYKPPFEMKKSRPHQEGFKPDSVVIESGFKPIVRRRDETTREDEDEYERAPMFARRDSRPRSSSSAHERDMEIDDAIESEGVYIATQNQNKQFEPMFKPSPLESVVEKKAPAEKLSGDLREMNVEEGEDKMAMAAERFDSFYLPPQGFPEGSVVTFDGKAVLDTALVNAAPSNEVQRRSDQGLSRIELLIRDKPQFGPFRGEIPPLSPELFSPESGAPIFNNAKNKRPVSEYINPITNGQRTDEKPISTKLTIVRPEPQTPVEEARNRTRRAAHHHPDHHGTGDDHDHHEHNYTSSVAKSHPEIFTSIFCAIIVIFGRH